MEKSWNFKISVWKNHGKNFEPHAHYPKKKFALRARHPMMMVKVILCSNFGAEGVAKRGDVEPTLKKSKMLYY